MDWLTLLSGLGGLAVGAAGALGIKKHFTNKPAPKGRAGFEAVEAEVRRAPPPPSRRTHYLDDEL